MNDKYKEYDDIVKTIVLNVLAEHKRNGDIILWNFCPERPADMLYYNVTVTTSTIVDKDIYLDMPLLKYWTFKRNRFQKNKRLRWISWRRAKKAGEENKTSVSAIMEYVREFYKIDNDLFEKINSEYYGVKNEDICN